MVGGPRGTRPDAPAAARPAAGEDAAARPGQASGDPAHGAYGALDAGPLDPATPPYAADEFGDRPAESDAGTLLAGTGEEAVYAHRAIENREIPWLGPVTRAQMRLVLLATLVFFGVVVGAVHLLPEPSAAAFGWTTVALATAGTCAASFWSARRVRADSRTWRRLLGAAALLVTPVAVVGAVSVSTGHPRPPASTAGFVWFILLESLLIASVLTTPTDPIGAEDDSGRQSAPLPLGLATTADHALATTPALPLGRRTSGRARWLALVVLDSLLVVGAAVVLGWELLVRDAAASGRLDTARFEMSVTAAVGDLVMLTLVCLIASLRRPRTPTALALFAAGVLCATVGDALFSYASVRPAWRISSWATLCLLAGWLLLGLCVLVPRRRPTTAAEATRRGTLWAHALFPYLAPGCVGILISAQTAGGAHVGRPELAALVGLLVLALCRQLFTLAEHTQLVSRFLASQRLLRHQAFHDPLTGVANRALFADRLRLAIERSAREHTPIALLFCDLDDFKRVNDTLGHEAGDLLLAIVARRMRSQVRKGDVVARLGGDEFAVLLEDSAEDPVAIGQRVRRAIAAPCVLGGQPYAVRASIGLVVTDPVTTEAAQVGSVTPDTLLAQADLAMYEAKRQGKGALVAYRPELSGPDSPSMLYGDLARALRDDPAGGTVYVLYQPIIELETGRTVAVEALAHWAHPALGDLDPGRLATCAEHAGLAVALDKAVMQAATADLAEARGRGDDLSVLITVSPGRMSEPTLDVEVRDLLDEHGLPARALVLALAESGRALDLGPAVPVLGRLAADGVRIALAGVGGPRHSLSAMRFLPVQIFVLDPGLLPSTAEAERAAEQQRARLTRATGGHARAWSDEPPGPGGGDRSAYISTFFDGDAGTVLRTAALRQTLVAAANSLGVTVVAAGVASLDQAVRLLDEECRYATGGLYGSPGTLAELTARCHVPVPIAAAR